MRTLPALLFVLLAISPSSWGLTMAEAIDASLQHNPNIARAAALVKAADARKYKAQAPFWPTIGADYSYRDGDSDQDFGDRAESSTSTYARYNLFNGGSDWFSHKAAKEQYAAAQWQHRSTAADTVLEVRQAYIEVLRTTQNLDTALKSLELLERQHRDASLRLEQGLIARNDLLRVAVEMATAQQNVVTVQGELAVDRQELSRLMGRPIENYEALEGVAIRNIAPGKSNDLKEEMLASRSELKYLQSLLAAQKAGRKAVYGEMLPDVDLSYSYDTSGNHLFPESSDSDYDSEVVTMVEASWTLFRGFKARYELAARHQEVLAIKEEIRATEDRLLVELSSSLEGYKTAHTNLETAQASLELAEENYRVNETRYKAQVATTVDLLDAQEFLTRTRNEEVKAQYDLYTAEAVIDRVLERNNPVRVTSDE